MFPEDYPDVNHKTNEKSKPLPCNQPCLKCGGTDINRTFRRVSDTFDLPGMFSERRKSVKVQKENPDYVDTDNYQLVAKKDCLQNHCRTCQFCWFSDTL